jgi:hypothetical protein
MAKNQELFLTRTGKVLDVDVPQSLLNTVVYTDAFNLNVDGVRLLKARVKSYSAIVPIDIEFISIAVFDGTNYHEIARLTQAELAAGDRDLFASNNFPVDKNNNKYMNLDYATGKLVIGMRSSSVNNQQEASLGFYYEEYS